MCLTGNVTMLTEPNPVKMKDSVFLLPASFAHQHKLDDLTAVSCAMETPGPRIRLAQG
jgi:hypothetical protein